MNTRFQALADQAEDWADSQNFYESDYRDYLMEKFAELIVRECMNTIATSNESRQTAYYYRNIVAEHFGVEQ